MSKQKRKATKAGKAAGKPHWVNTHVGRRLRVQRKAQGMSQETLGSKVGVSFQQIQKYENGTNRISVGMLHELCQALDLTYYDLLPSDGGDAANSNEPVTVDMQQKHVTF